jgi:hypothetical protein
MVLARALLAGLMLMAALGLGPRPARAQESTPAVASPIPGAPCVQGRWRVIDLGTYIEESFTGMFGVTALEFKEASGDFIFEYLPDGTEIITAQNYELRMDAKVRIVGKVGVTVKVEGRATSRYAIDGDTLVVTETNRDDFEAEAKFPFATFEVDGEEILHDGTFRFTCDVNTLVIYPEPEEELTITYERLGTGD